MWGMKKVTYKGGYLNRTDDISEVRMDNVARWQYTDSA